MEVTNNNELILDFRDLAYFKRSLDEGLSVDECIKGLSFIDGVEPTWTKSVRMSAEPNENEKEFADYILQSIRAYISKENNV
ncbi:hypothetical protein FH508_0008730 [Lysinibacillus sp. CD3-6]|uniref:hypothetical protein n=1 Tax=Lysinibacillus sp. CD3-6 TaxID=2892541 RepID=UPI001121FB25|nr:hypothetical protein [Lysinibacillus sp. CD3-6]UED81964.1 hypothetical protein FH508_0008730 [Lysinibacillus sp. CD3-6]